MVDELSFVSIKWLNPLWKKLNKIWKKRGGELDQLANTFGDPRLLAQYYIEPNCQHHNPANYDEDNGPRSYVKTPIFTTLNDFLSEPKLPADGRNHLFVLADAGMGKTSLLMMLKLTQLMNFWPKNYDCLLLKLGESTLQQIEQQKQKAQTVLLLDALDEDPKAFGRIGDRIQELIEATLTFRHVIISCRTQFFPKPEQDAFDRDGRVVVSNYTCPMLFVSFFDDRQVKEYLVKRFPNPWHHGLSKRQDPKLLKALTAITAMKSLRFRPLLLAHIEDVLESEGKLTTSYLIYQALIKKWLQREIGKMHHQKLLNVPNEAQLWQACRVLAVYLQALAKRELPESDLKQLIQRLPTVENLQHLDFGGRSLLNRTSNMEYRFAHYSIQEFLVVNAFLNGSVDEALHYKPVDISINKIWSTPQMWEFLVEMHPDFAEIRAYFACFTEAIVKPVVFDVPVNADHPSLQMVLLPTDFSMGDVNSSLSFATPFCIGRNPITFNEYDQFCRATGREMPSAGQWERGQRPVINVSWQDAKAYCVWLSAVSGCHFRLPTNGEWEYACRAGTTTKFFWGDGIDDAERYAWFNANSKGETHQVGLRDPNPWGLCDMVGNVWEWVENNMMDGTHRVLRGGSWLNGSEDLRSASRRGGSASNNDIGFRVVMKILE